jgi:hypothetical protein
MSPQGAPPERQGSSRASLMASPILSSDAWFSAPSGGYMAFVFSTVVTWSHFNPRIAGQPALACPEIGTQAKGFVLDRGDRHYAHVQRMAIQGVGRNHERWPLLVEREQANLSAFGKPLGWSTASALGHSVACQGLNRGGLECAAFGPVAWRGPIETRGFPLKRRPPLEIQRHTQEPVHPFTLR